MDSDTRINLTKKYIGRMPSLSTTVTKVLEVCNHPATSPNDLNRVIALDPILTGQVLKLINSAYYAFPNKITSLTRAIIMLGINTVKNLVLGASVVGKFGNKGSFKSLSVDEFWEHSLAVGVMAKILALRSDVSSAEREEYFVAGLLHDLGKIPLSSRFPDDYSKVLRASEQVQISLRRAEESLLGFDHGHVGKMIAEKWKLTPALKFAIELHHRPDQAEKEHIRMVQIVALANIYANLFGVGASGNRKPDMTLAARLREQIGLSDDDIQGYRESIDEEIEKAKVFLQVSRKG
jgi:putative nucleotidyltransferase with HDIG domain